MPKFPPNTGFKMKSPFRSDEKVKGHDGSSRYTQEEVDNMSSLDKNRYLHGINRGGRPGDYKGPKVPMVGEVIG